ncbi:MAG TPA: hypothetical protein VIF15_18240 [Polyangiaceae bacterium]|jgi:hypothetical protein
MLSIEALRALAMAVWGGVHPTAPRMADAPVIANAIATVIAQDAEPPVFGSHEEDAAVMAYYALRESWLQVRAVGDGGVSFGVWQEHASTGRADVVTQAKAWLVLLRDGARVCPASPAAPLSGGCTAARKLADKRVARARALLAASHPEALE